MTHNTNIVRELRDMLPKRPITLRDAKVVAEHQATVLLHMLRIVEPPVDISVIVDLPRLTVAIDAELQRRWLSSESGWSHGRWMIKVNPADTVNRRRFALAHEFKHVLDGPAERLTYRSLGNGNAAEKTCQVEEIADHFAACLLMPRSWIDHAARTGLRDVQQLAAIFAVSPIAMGRRVREMGMKLQRPDLPANSPRHYFFSDLRVKAVSSTQRKKGGV